MRCVIVIAIMIIMVEFITNNIALSPVHAQQTSEVADNSNMGSAMIASARMHLMDANKALTTGNTSAALEQLNLAQLQISMMGMKTMTTLNQTKAMDFMTSGNLSGMIDPKMIPENCILLNTGVLQCRDSLTQSISFSR
jgi:hypothetical protein